MLGRLLSIEMVTVSNVSMLNPITGLKVRCFLKQRTTNFIVSKNYACPFLIRFSIPGVKTKTVPTIFREVKIA